MVGNMVGQVVKDPGFSTEHQEVGSLTSTGVRGAAVSPYDLRKNRILFLLAVAEEQMPKHISQHAVFALHNPITLWVIRGGPALVYSS